MGNIFIKYIKFLIILSIIYLVAIPYIFAKMLPAICENLSFTTKYEISIQNPKLRTNIIPIISLMADNISVKQKETGDSIQMENAYIRFRMLPILSGKLHINKIAASNMVISTYLQETPELDKNFVETIKRKRINLDYIKIKNFNASIFTKEIPQPIVYRGKDFLYKKNNRYLKLCFDGSVSLKDKISEAKINLFLPRNDVNKTVVEVDLSNFDIAPIGDYFKQYLPKDLQFIKGIINLKINKTKLLASLANCKIIMQDSPKSIIFPEKLDIEANFNLTSKKIKFENISFKSKNINMSASGLISNYLDKNLARMNLDFQFNKSKLEDIIPMLPSLELEDINIYKLKLYKFYGNIIGNFSIKGNYSEPEVYGNIFINDGILIKPIPNAKGAIIKLKFTGKYLNFDVNVPTSSSEKVLVKGGVELYNVKYSDMRIWSTKNVDLKIAQDKVLPLHEILNFVLGPVPIMDMKGIGNIDITVKGNRQNPHVWGVFNLNNLKTYFHKMPHMIIESKKVQLTFDDTNVVMKTEGSSSNGVGMNIAGNGTMSGKFNIDASSDKQLLRHIYDTVQTSTLIEDIQKMLPKLDYCDGYTNLKLKIYGAVKDINDLQFNTNFFANGTLELLDNDVVLNGLQLQRTSGIITFENTNADVDLKSFIGNSEFSLKGLVKNNFADFNVNIPKFNLIDIFDKKTKLEEDLCNITMKADIKYKGKSDEVEYDKINFSAEILGVDKKNKLKVSNGYIKYKNDNLQLSNIKGIFVDTKSEFDINLNANNVSKKPDFSGSVKLKSFELPALNIFRDYDVVPEEIKNIRFDRGKINLDCKIKNNNADAYLDLGGVWLTYVPTNLPLKIINGSLILKNNVLKINKVNILADDMPILFDGKINDIFDNNVFDIYVNSKPRQDFIEKYVNKNRIYPVKIKGDIVYSTKLKGTKTNFDVIANADLAPEASIYHLGATVGDIENAIAVNLNANILNGNQIRLKEFSYDKIIQSQGSRKTKLNMLKANGSFSVAKDDLIFNNLHIKTTNPTDARIFNIIFRKPNIKQGQFTSDLKFNGKLSNLKLNGTFHIFETNIPFLDTTMKNITFLFKDKVIELTSSGEVLGNDIRAKAMLKNKLVPPYYVEDGYVYTTILDINDITNKIKLSQVDEFQAFNSFENFDISSLVVKNLHLIADKIYLRNLIAEKFDANVSWSDKKLLNVNKFKFNLSNGTLNGNFVNNIPKNKIDIAINAKNIDANELSYAIFNLKNQIYGNLTGDVKLSCIGTDFDNCMKTLNGTTTFNVAEGKMPKLGSLEYLLRASNLVKGGLTSLTINSVIDIITPLRTGEFSNIYGKLDIKDGVAEDISIASSGKNLSLFMSGTYNFSTAHAQMEVLGMLSKKISTMFGGIGNVSLNTFFNVIPGIDLSKNSKLLENINKIPGIELSNKAYRKFLAEIKGNINGDDYVTSFKWIN